MGRPINIGLCGLGTVGTGVVDLLKKNYTLIKQRIGKEIKITKALVRMPEKHLNKGFAPDQISNVPEFILNDPDIDIVIELIGGDSPAKEIILTALQNGKSVVTANKALLATYADEIFPAAYRAKGHFGYEASVGGGIPVIRNLRDGFPGNEISEVSGIINGTTNYILFSMTDKEETFEAALKSAQELGYAEADPALDIEGTDTAHKIAILLSLAYNGLFDFSQIHVEGITNIEPIDIEIAGEMGFTIKLIGKAAYSKQGYEGRVHPALIRNTNLLASVAGAFNAILIRGNFLGPTISYGVGAGAYPTASAVVSDIVEIGRSLTLHRSHSNHPLSCTNATLVRKNLVPISQIRSKYYLRFAVHDQVGVLAGITKILGDNDISICSMIQRAENDESKQSVPVVIFTHEAMEKNVQNALQEIDRLPFVLQPTKIIRIDSVS